jgi:hypothetical protein
MRIIDTINVNGVAMFLSAALAEATSTAFAIGCCMQRHSCCG